MLPGATGATTAEPQPSRSSYPSESGFPTEYAQAEVNYRQALLDRQREVQKYKDIDGMTKDQKLDALKDLSVNPFILNDGYDALTNALYRWKTIATSPEAAKLSPQERDQAAENYWRTMLEPIYSQKLKATPVSLEIWKKEAYDRALQWNMDTAYDSHWRSGLYTGFKDYENVLHTGLSALAGMIRSEAAAYGQLHGLKTEKKDIPEIPVLDSTVRSVKRASDIDTFWHDINPNITWQEKARAGVTELAMDLPLYKAAGGFNEGLIGGLTGEAKVPLTQLLSKSHLGATVTKLLLNGGEGAAYGYTMVDPSERKDAWKAGVAQAILGTLFSSAGKNFRLKDVVNPARASELGEAEIEANLGTKGFVKHDVEGLRDEAAQALSGISAAGGRPAVLQVIKSALAHLKETEGMSELEIREGIQNHLEKDAPRWKSTFITSAYLRALLGEQGKKFSEFTPADTQELRKHLIDLIQRGEEGMPKVVAQGKGDTVATVAAEKSSRKPIEQVLDAIGRRDTTSLPADLRGSKPRYGYRDKLFELKFEDPRDLAAYTLSQTTKNKAHDRFLSWYTQHLPEENLKVHAQRVRDFIKNIAKDGNPEEGPITISSQVKEETKRGFKIPEGDPGRLRIRTKYGKDAVSYSANMEWIAEAKKRVEEAGLKWNSADISKWLSKDGGISHEDFVDDLKEFFYPKALKELDPELTWEYKNEETGKEWPNFLAFMYNYTDQMPKQFAERLSQELEDTQKFERWFDPKQDLEPQKIDYAQGMYAHIQELLASERYKKPNALGQIGNVYQTTYQDIKNPTEHQLTLHKETVDAETELLRKMFRGKKNEPALKQALEAYKIMADARKKAFLKGAQSTRIARQADIDRLIVEKSKGSRVPLEF